MGADIFTYCLSEVVIVQIGGISCARVMASYLRAISSLVIAGLSASGRTEISRIYHLERGYENLVSKLSGVGARIWKENE